jgi:hypothetical protein
MDVVHSRCAGLDVNRQASSRRFEVPRLTAAAAKS